MSTENVSPEIYFENTTWELISQNRVLMGAGDGHSGGDTVEAGLPNITGTMRARTPQTSVDLIIYRETIAKDSALYAGDPIEWSGQHAAFSWTQKTPSAYQYLNIDASRSSPIYGNSTTVQPPAFYVYMWRRAS